MTNALVLPIVINCTPQLLYNLKMLIRQDLKAGKYLLHLQLHNLTKTLLLSKYFECLEGNECRNCEIRKCYDGN
jgi:hypothetical protein